MNYKLDRAELLRTLAAVHKHNGLTPAAHVLFLTVPAVLYRLRALEKLVGVEVYKRERQRQRAELTPEGVALLREGGHKIE